MSEPESLAPETQAEDEMVKEKLETLEAFERMPLMIRETRLIAMINMRSGGGKGAKLARELENNGLATVFDLVQCSKPDYLDKLQKELSHAGSDTRVVIAGGDGTVAWGFGVLDKIVKRSNGTVKYPPCAIFPLGTGNELCGCLGWGSTFPPLFKDVQRGNYREKVFEGEVVGLDRWLVEINEVENSDAKGADGEKDRVAPTPDASGATTDTATLSRDALHADKVEAPTSALLRFFTGIRSPKTDPQPRSQSSGTTDDTASTSASTSRGPSRTSTGRSATNPTTPAATPVPAPGSSDGAAAVAAASSRRGSNASDSSAAKKPPPAARRLSHESLHGGRSPRDALRVDIDLCDAPRGDKGEQGTGTFLRHDLLARQLSPIEDSPMPSPLIIKKDAKPPSPDSSRAASTPPFPPSKRKSTSKRTRSLRRKKNSKSSQKRGFSSLFSPRTRSPSPSRSRSRSHSRSRSKPRARSHSPSLSRSRDRRQPLASDTLSPPASADTDGGISPRSVSSSFRDPDRRRSRSESAASPRKGASNMSHEKKDASLPDTEVPASTPKDSAVNNGDAAPRRNSPSYSLASSSDEKEAEPAVAAVAAAAAAPQKEAEASPPSRPSTPTSSKKRDSARGSLRRRKSPLQIIPSALESLFGLKKDKDKYAAVSTTSPKTPGDNESEQEYADTTLQMASNDEIIDANHEINGSVPAALPAISSLSTDDGAAKKREDGKHAYDAVALHSDDEATDGGGTTPRQGELFASKSTPNAESDSDAEGESRGRSILRFSLPRFGRTRSRSQPPVANQRARAFGMFRTVGEQTKADSQREESLSSDYDEIPMDEPLSLSSASKQLTEGARTPRTPGIDSARGSSSSSGANSSHMSSHERKNTRTLSPLRSSSALFSSIGGKPRHKRSASQLQPSSIEYVSNRCVPERGAHTEQNSRRGSVSSYESREDAYAHDAFDFDEMEPLRRSLDEQRPANTRRPPLGDKRNSAPVGRLLSPSSVPPIILPKRNGDAEDAAAARGSALTQRCDSLSLASPASSKRAVKPMFAFASLGFDAKIAHKFHSFRESSQNPTNSITKIKLLHAWYGWTEIFPSRSTIRDVLSVWVDGKKLELPRKIRILHVMNISTSGLADLIKPHQPNRFKDNENFNPEDSNPGDGVLEVVATRHLTHMLVTQMQITHPIRLAQGRHVEIELREPISMQVDGEPWVQNPARISLRYRDTVAMVQGHNESRFVPFKGPNAQS